MSTEEINKNLAKWAEGNLSKEELALFKKSKDYKLYERILVDSDGFFAPEFNKEKVFVNIQNKVEGKKKSKVIPLFKKWSYSVAATIAIGVGIFYFMNNSTSYKTEFGQQMVINLPDASEVILNAKSSISFNEKKWNNNRSLQLNGEAFFKVQKGSTFTVKTNEGTVKVLGTKFNVLQEGDYFEVKCFEGKVLVRGKNKIETLVKGEVFKQIGTVVTRSKDTIKELNPTWTNGESYFKSTPLKVVLKAIEKQYNVSFNDDAINDEKLYTGSFVHNNLNVALRTVILPMNLSFEISEDKKLVKLK